MLETAYPNRCHFGFLWLFWQETGTGYISYGSYLLIPLISGVIVTPNSSLFVTSQNAKGQGKA